MKTYKFKEAAYELCHHCETEVLMTHSHCQCTTCKADLNCCSMCTIENCGDCDNGSAFTPHQNVENATIVCEDCDNDFPPDGGKHYKYEPSIWLCDDCDAHRMGEEEE